MFATFSTFHSVNANMLTIERQFQNRALMNLTFETFHLANGEMSLKDTQSKNSPFISTTLETFHLSNGEMSFKNLHLWNMNFISDTFDTSQNLKRKCHLKIHILKTFHSFFNLISTKCKNSFKRSHARVSFTQINFSR